jgi:tripartite ATP-independent transporter DctP family solute receptor
MKAVLILVIASIMAICFAPAGSGAADVIELKIGHLSAVGGVEDLAVNKIAEVAQQKSKGRIKIKVFPGAQTGNFISQMEAVHSGAQDMVWGSLGWLGNFIKDYQILVMAYNFRSQSHLDKFMDSPLGQNLKKQLLDRGWLLVREHAAPLPKVVVSKKPIFTVEDVKGIKMRVPEWPISIKVWEAMGSKPVRITWGEAYLALSQGVADAVECGFEFTYPAKFHEVAKYITWTYHNFDTRGAVMNPKKFNSLPKDLQQVIVDACIAGEKLYNELAQQAKEDHTEKMVKAGAVIINTDIEPFRQKAIKIVDELEDQGFWSKGLFKKAQEIL